MPSAHERNVLLVGSMPYDTVEEGMRTAGELLGDQLLGIPDGEVGLRKIWIGFLPRTVYSKHPDLRVTRSPDTGVQVQPDDKPDVWEASFLFALNPGVTELRFDDLGYATEALESYKTFKRLRSEGTIPEGVRFQVCLPATGSAVSYFFSEPEEWPIIHAAYHDAIGREIEKILEVVPADELQVQFDFAMEFVDLAVGDGHSIGHWPEATFEEKIERHAATIGPLTERVPDDVMLGIHWCYGTWGGWPMKDMGDLSACVRMSNEAKKRSAHDLSYIHMPVSLDPEDSFFAPLADLEVGDTEIYLGLVHHSDGVEGCTRRIAQAHKYLEQFGIGAVCGYGRVDPRELPDIFRLHQECSHALAETV